MKTAKVRYQLLWFAPGGGINLCGHTTLATAFVLMTEVDTLLNYVEFETLSGRLAVERNKGWYTMYFPQQDYHEISVTEDVEKALGIRPSEAYLGR